MQKRRLIFPISSMLVLLLCGTVFAWVLGARLSHYKAHQPAHPKVVAKLILDGQLNKRLPRKFNAGRPADESSGQQSATQKAFIPLQLRSTAHPLRPMCPPILACLRSYPHALYFRPPPLSL